MMNQSDEFLAYVIKTWAKEMRTESSIGFEFIARGDRSPLLSSVSSLQDDILIKVNEDSNSTG